MKKKILILLVVCGLVGMAVAYFQYNKPHRDIASEKTDFYISADLLYDAFELNEKEANAKYLDKVIEISGKIMGVETNQEGNELVILEAENAMIGGVLCTLEKGESLKPSGEAKLKCRCTGFLDDVVLTDCTIVK